MRPRATLEAVTVRGPTRPPRLGADFLPVVGYADDAIIVASSSRSQVTVQTAAQEVGWSVSGPITGRIGSPDFAEWLAESPS